MTKIIYCADCWNKNIGPKCKPCPSYNKDRPYFCGSCNYHVKGIKAEKIEPLIKLIKKSKIPIPDGISEYSWSKL